MTELSKESLHPERSFKFSKRCSNKIIDVRKAAFDLELSGVQYFLAIQDKDCVYFKHPDFDTIYRISPFFEDADNLKNVEDLSLIYDEDTDLAYENQVHSTNGMGGEYFALEITPVHTPISKDETNMNLLYYSGDVNPLPIHIPSPANTALRAINQPVYILSATDNTMMLRISDDRRQITFEWGIGGGRVIRQTISSFSLYNQHRGFYEMIMQGDTVNMTPIAEQVIDYIIERMPDLFANALNEIINSYD